MLAIESVGGNILGALWATEFNLDADSRYRASKDFRCIGAALICGDDEVSDFVDFRGSSARNGILLRSPDSILTFSAFRLPMKCRNATAMGVRRDLDGDSKI